MASKTIYNSRTLYQATKKDRARKVYETKLQQPTTDGKWVKVDSKTMKFVKNG